MINRKLYIPFILCLFLFNSCVSVPQYFSTENVEVDYDNLNTDQKGVSLKFITQSYRCANKEIFIMAKKAQELGFRYFVISSYTNNEYLSNYGSGSYYIGGGIIYAFNDYTESYSWRDIGIKTNLVDDWVNAGIEAGLFEPKENKNENNQDILLFK